MLDQAIFLVKAAIFFSDFFAPAVTHFTQEPPATTVSVVVDAQGKPVAGAEVACEIVFDDGKTSLLQAVRTDAQGHFDLALPREEVYPIVPHGPGMLTVSCLATAAGHRPAFEQHAWYPNGWRLELDQPSPGRVKVLDPEGRPIEGAMIVPSPNDDGALLTVAVLGLGRGVGDKHFNGDPWACLKHRLIERLAATTDKEGAAAVAGGWLTKDTRGATEVVIVTPRFGRQWCRLDFSKSRQQVVRLQGLGRVVGQVVAERPELVRNVRLRACSRSHVFSEVLVTTDAQGRFEIPAIAAGKLDIGPLGCTTRLPSSEPLYYFTRVAIVDVRAGATTKVTLPYQRAVRLHGVAREKETGKPIPNARVNSAHAWNVRERPTDGYPDERIGFDFDFNVGNGIKTDDQGHFEVYVLPGTMQIQVGSIMRPRSVAIPEGTRDHELTPVELTRIELGLDRLLPDSVKEMIFGT